MLRWRRTDVFSYLGTCMWGPWWGGPHPGTMVGGTPSTAPPPHHHHHAKVAVILGSGEIVEIGAPSTFYD